MVSQVKTVSFQGIEVIDVNIQAHFSPGMPAFALVGLPDKTIAESRERIRAALHSIGLILPSQRIIVNLSPADLMKEGSHFDLPIAIALLINMGIISQEDIEGYLVLGELALNANLVSINGALPAAVGAVQREVGLICPAKNGSEAAWSGNQNIIAAENLIQLINHLKNRQTIAQPFIKKNEESEAKQPDIKDIKGQALAKRAIEIAAVGRHNILMCGPPGAGKSMLASRLPSILPKMSPKEILETSMVSSIAGALRDGALITDRPFRSPHHSCSMPAMVGGGNNRRVAPGEISLAHNGVLFLDELPEFQRVVIDSLRQPMEEGRINISRASNHVSYPAKFQLIAAMNPCRCGYFGDVSRGCNRFTKCGVEYMSKISGPFFDRIDLYIEMVNIPISEIMNCSNSNEDSASVATRVSAAYEFQEKRYAGTGIKNNTELCGDLLNDFASPTQEARDFLNTAAEKMGLSMRGYNRSLKLARSIADLEGEEKINKQHISEALNYRRNYYTK